MRLHFSDVRGTILDIEQDKRTEVFNFGDDNAYPSLIETLIKNSVTSRACVNMVAKAIYGKGFGEVGDIIVNKGGETLNDVLRISGREFMKHFNLFIWVGYDATLKINAMKVVPVTHVRIGKDDDRGYSGKYIVYDNWDKKKVSKIMSNRFQIVNAFNPDPKIVKYQIEKTKGGINNYRGQILHLKIETIDKYAESQLHPVLNDALLEYNASVYKSRGAEGGFLNTKLLVTKPFSDEEDGRKFSNKLKEVQGAKNSGRVFHMETENTSDSIAEEFSLQDMTSEFKSELFEYAETTARKNIALAFGVPVGLIDVSESSLFGNSGELIREMRKMLWEQREEERQMIQDTFTRVLKNWTESIEDELEILSPYEDDTTQEQQTEETETL